MCQLVEMEIYGLMSIAEELILKMLFKGGDYYEAIIRRI